MKRTWPGLFGGAFVLCLVVHAGCANDAGDVIARLDGGSGAQGPELLPTVDAGVDAAPVLPPAETELACLGTECPYPYATCPTPTNPAPYKCGTNLLVDNGNCGECDNVCPVSRDLPELNINTRCIDGTCRMICLTGYQDCNALVDDGCEVRTSNDPDNCGACGNRCPEDSDGNRVCINGACGCPYPQTLCGSFCTDTSRDGANCGECGNRCQRPPDAEPLPPNMVYGCQEGKCAAVCRQDWADCNDDVELDGCETYLLDPTNCGACKKVCAPGQICYVPRGQGPTPICACEPHETLCTVAGQFRCVDLLSDFEHCGMCGYACPSESKSITTCKNGFCEDECQPGWGDCDGDKGNGCETDLLANPLNCGACGIQCDVASGQPCVNGRCLMVECDAGPAVAR